MGDEALIGLFTNVKIWRRGDERAPHKPLLLLWTLARVQSKKQRLSPYDDVEKNLRELLLNFGPPRRASHPEHPFWRLKNDEGLWEIPEAPELEKLQSSSGDISPSKLRSNKAHGGFTNPVYQLLRKRPDLVNSIAARLLEDHFPSSLHEEILDAVGMPWVVEPYKPRRDPGFRETILRIYEHRCAVCGYDGKLCHADLGLEVAHLKWHASGGPDSEDNGVSLCTFHHKTLDRGAWGLDDERRILVSEDVHGGRMVDELILRYSGEHLRTPLKGQPELAKKFIDWHKREVFREPARSF